MDGAEHDAHKLSIGRSPPVIGPAIMRDSVRSVRYSQRYFTTTLQVTFLLPAL